MHRSPSNNTTECGSKPSKISDPLQKDKRKGFLPKIRNNVKHENEQWAIKALPTDWGKYNLLIINKHTRE